MYLNSLSAPLPKFFLRIMLSHSFTALIPLINKYLNVLNPYNHSSIRLSSNLLINHLLVSMNMVDVVPIVTLLICS